MRTVFRSWGNYVHSEDIMKRLRGKSFITLATTLAVLTPVWAQAHPAEAGTARAIRFDIDASDLRSAISKFSKVSGVQVVVAPYALNGQTSGGVHGSMSARDAIDMLLRGTRLTATFDGDVAVLKPATRRPDRAAPAVSSQLESGSAPLPDISNANRPDDIIVSGYRQSIDAAQALKRHAVGAEDDILATDIAAFPDLNLAESLQRIPGITITRDTGEGRQIALRGLGADFTRTQLNGMEVLGNTASGMDNRGGVSRTRSFDYSLFASELFNRVAVQKSFSAEQDEGGIAGTVQLTSAKAFDAGDKLVISAKGQTNEYASGVTPRVAALVSHRWGDFAALVSVAYSEIKSVEFGYRNWGWGLVKYNPANIGPNIDSATRNALINGVYAPQAESPSSWYTDRHRLGLTTSLQYHPGNDFKLDVDLLYGRLADHRDDYALASAGSNALTGTPISGTQVIQSAVVDSTDTLRAASYTGIDLRSEHHIIVNHTDFYQGVANASWNVSDRLTVHALGGYEESDFGQPVFDKVFLELKNTAFSFDDRPTVPVNTYGANLTDPNNWNLQRLDVQQNKISSQYANGKIDLDYRLTDVLTFKVGGEFKHFINSGYTWVNKVFHNVPTDTVIPNNLKQGVGTQTLLQYTVGNVNGVYNYIGDPTNLSPAYLQAGSDYKIDEQTWASYMQVDLDTMLAGMRLRANAGLRYYSTDLTSSGHLATGGGYEPVAIGTDSHAFLPAANVALDVSKEVVARLSASRDVNRPALADLAAAGSITTRPNGGSLSLGNPYLRPYMATSVEGSVEYYMDHHGFASLGFFFKHMDSFITSATTNVPYGQTGLPLSLLVQGEDASTVFTVTQPINGPGANIKGLEAALQHDFNFLPGALKHFGVVANGTWFDGAQTVFYSGVPKVLPLYNLSKWAANATLYYENSVWGARISDAYRSGYLTGAGTDINNSGDGYRGTNNVDFQAHYNIRPRMRLIAEAINLTNEPIVQSVDLNANRTEVYTKSGRTFTFGFSAEF